MSDRHPIVPPIYFFAALLVQVGLYLYVPFLAIVPSPFNLIGALLVVLGLASTISSSSLFRRVGTPVRPFLQSTVLVTSGAYRVTRNPMYMGMVLMLLGVAILLETAAAFLPIPFFVWQIRRKFVLPEERFLEGLFGQQYLDYKARVRRWL